MNIHKKKDVGKLGEDIATKYLENKGFRIMERNFIANKGKLISLQNRAKK